MNNVMTIALTQICEVLNASDSKRKWKDSYPLFHQQRPNNHPNCQLAKEKIK